MSPKWGSHQIIGFLITLIAQIKVTSSYSKYKQIENKKRISGFEVARKILDSFGLEDIHVVEVNGNLTDHYDPSNKVVRLSTDVFHGESIASLAVAAHECGHALQDKDNYNYMIIRSKLVPVVNFVTKMGYFVTIIGIIAGLFDIIVCGIVVLGVTLLFQLVTLPVEFNASKRAKGIIDNLNLADKEEQNGVSKMLSAAAFTYVASVLNTIFQILRLLIISNNNRD